MWYVKHKQIYDPDKVTKFNNWNKKYIRMSNNLIINKEMRFSMKSCHYHIESIYSEKATKFCEIFTLLMTVCTAVKSKVKILQNFVAFSEYMNFTCDEPVFFQE